MRYFIIVTLGILAGLNSFISYILLLLLFFGYSGAYTFFNLLVSWLLLRIWKKSSIHNHKVVSLFIIFVQGQPEILLFLFNSYWLLLAIFALVIVVISSREIIENFAFEVLYIEHFKLLFYEGIGCLIFSALCFFLLQVITCDCDDSHLSLNCFCSHTQLANLTWQFDGLFGFISIDTLFIWLYFIATLSVNIFRVILNKNKGPTQRFTADLIAFALFIIIDICPEFVLDYDQIFKWESIVIILILIIGCLIYNENVKLYFCSLALSTRAEIQKRAVIDSFDGMEFVGLTDKQELNNI